MWKYVVGKIDWIDSAHAVHSGASPKAVRSPLQRGLEPKADNQAPAWTKTGFGK
jgi:hypothetical protein